MGGQDAWVTRKQSSRDAMAMPGVREVRSRKTILRRDRRNAHTRAFPARTRGVVFSLATVWRHARPSSDPRPPDSRAPSSSFSSPTAAVGAEHGTSRGASREFRVSRSIAAPRAASPPHPRTPSADAHIFKDEDRTCANASSFPSDGSLPDFAVLARARGGHHPRRRVHQAGHGVRRRPARHRRAAQGTSIRRRRADPRPPRARRTPRENVRGARTESENDDSPPPLWRLAEDFFSNEALFGALRVLRRRRRNSPHPRPVHHSRDRR